MENIIISIVGVILLFAIAIFATNWKEKKEKEFVDTFARTKKSAVEENTSGSDGKGYIGTIDKNSEKVKPKKKTPKAKASKPEFPITDNKPKPGAKRGRKPKKDKGNDLLLS